MVSAIFRPLNSSEFSLITLELQNFPAILQFPIFFLFLNRVHQKFLLVYMNWLNKIETFENFKIIFREIKDFSKAPSRSVANLARRNVTKQTAYDLFNEGISTNNWKTFLYNYGSFFLRRYQYIYITNENEKYHEIQKNIQMKMRKTAYYQIYG